MQKREQTRGIGSLSWPTIERTVRETVQMFYDERYSLDKEVMHD